MTKINIRTFEAFAGYGSQCSALERLKNKYQDIFDFEVVGISEIEPNAIKAYQAIHGKTKNYGDISQVETCTLPNFDLFTYSFPCFTGNTPVFTRKGFIKIKNIKVGDEVLTYKNQFKKVTKFYNNGVKAISIIYFDGLKPIETTINHRFLILRGNILGWISCECIKSDDLFCVSKSTISQKELDLLNIEEESDEYYFIKSTKILHNQKEENVYDIEVEDDHSFIVNHIVVHNCTDISSLGKRMGFQEGSGTRSSLLWECKKVINTKKPKYLLLENVSDLINKENLPLFKIWLEWLEEQGYTTYYKVVNSMNFNVPQSRDRVFAVSFLGEHEPFVFPEGTKTLVTLDDVLETNAAEKYYTKKKYYYVKKTKPCANCKDVHCTKLCDCGYEPELKIHTNKMESFYKQQSVANIDNEKFKEVMNTQLLTLNLTYNDIKKALGLKSNDRIKKWFLVDNKYPKVSEWDKVKEILQITTNEFDCIGEEHLEPIKFNMVKSVRHHTGIHGTLVCNDTIFSVQIPRTHFEEGKTYHQCRQINPSENDIEYCNDCIHYEQRLLTPREFWRLMDMTDEDYDKVVETGVNETMMYKLAGNSIVVSVLEALFEQMFIPEEFRK